MGTYTGVGTIEDLDNIVVHFMCNVPVEAGDRIGLSHRLLDARNLEVTMIVQREKGCRTKREAA